MKNFLNPVWPYPEIWLPKIQYLDHELQELYIYTTPTWSHPFLKSKNTSQMSPFHSRLSAYFLLQSLWRASLHLLWLNLVLACAKIISYMSQTCPWGLAFSQTEYMNVWRRISQTTKTLVHIVIIWTVLDLNYGVFPIQILDNMSCFLYWKDANTLMRNWHTR